MDSKKVLYTGFLYKKTGLETDKLLEALKNQKRPQFLKTLKSEPKDLSFALEALTTMLNENWSILEGLNLKTLLGATKGLGPKSIKAIEEHLNMDFETAVSGLKKADKTKLSAFLNKQFELRNQFENSTGYLQKKNPSKNPNKESPAAKAVDTYVETFGVIEKVVKLKNSLRLHIVDEKEKKFLVNVSKEALQTNRHFLKEKNTVAVKGEHKTTKTANQINNVVLKDQISLIRDEYKKAAPVPTTAEEKTAWLLDAFKSYKGVSYTAEKPLKDLIDFEKQMLDGVDVEKVKNLRVDFSVGYKSSSNNFLFAIEVDGSSHLDDEAKKRDLLKNQILHAAGIPLLRVHNHILTHDDLRPLLIGVVASVLDQKSSIQYDKTVFSSTKMSDHFMAMNEKQWNSHFAGKRDVDSELIPVFFHVQKIHGNLLCEARSNDWNRFSAYAFNLQNLIQWQNEQLIDLDGVFTRFCKLKALEKINYHRNSKEKEFYTLANKFEAHD